MRRIGIYGGTFDPIHSGHISFALQAMRLAQLDEVVFLPERRPRGKTGITHFAHRVAMIKSALKAHPKLTILELSAQKFLPSNTLPILNKLYPDDELFLLLGSDVVYGLSKWPFVASLLQRVGLVIGIRGSDQEITLQERISELPVKPFEVHIISVPHPVTSSRAVREALAHSKKADGLLTSVKSYSKKHWLYRLIPK